jgi:hypothetical protein
MCTLAADIGLTGSTLFQLFTHCENESPDGMLEQVLQLLKKELANMPINSAERRVENKPEEMFANPDPEWLLEDSDRILFPQFWEVIAKSTLCKYSGRKTAQQLLEVRSRAAFVKCPSVISMLMLSFMKIFKSNRATKYIYDQITSSDSTRVAFFKDLFARLECAPELGGLAHQARFGTSWSALSDLERWFHSSYIICRPRLHVDGRRRIRASALSSRPARQPSYSQGLGGQELLGQLLDGRA